MNNDSNRKYHILSLLVENKHGVLARVAGLFAGRGYNIHSLTAAETEDPGLSKIIITCKDEMHVIEQVKKQVNKIIDVIKIIDLTTTNTVDRELGLIKINCKAQQRQEAFQITEAFRARVVDIGQDSAIFEITGNSEKLDAFVSVLQQYGIVEIVRTGLISLQRGVKPTQTADAAKEPVNGI